MHTCKVSVRDLVEFILRSGDIVSSSTADGRRAGHHGPGGGGAAVPHPKKAAKADGITIPC